MGLYSEITLGQITRLNSGVGGVGRAQRQIRQGDLPFPPTGDAGVDIGLAMTATLVVKLREAPIRRQATVSVAELADSTTYDLDVGTSTASETTGSPASENDLIDGLEDAVNQLSEPVLANAFDVDGDGDLDTIQLEGNWNRITVTEAQSEDYTVTVRGTDATITSDGSLTGADLVDDIVDKLASEIDSISEPVDATPIDNDGDGLFDVLYVGPTSSKILQLVVSATGAGGLSIDASGDASDIVYADATAASGASLDVARDATSVDFEVWGRDRISDTWELLNGLGTLTAVDNWTERLVSLAAFDRLFVRVTSTDGRVVPAVIPALG